MKLIFALIAAALLGGVAGGLRRAGVLLPGAGDAAWLDPATAQHAALMIGGFLGTVIGLERATAARSRAAFAAPAASALGGACLLLGQTAAGAWLGVAAAIAFVVVNAVIVGRQRAAHTVVLLAGALAWLAGNLLFAAGMTPAALPWWFAFLVTTIAAERLEMTRLMRHGPWAGRLLGAVLTLLFVAATGSVAAPAAGGALFGSALVLLAAWFGWFDIARRTVRAHGLARYMAVALLGGYGWLAIAGAAWVGVAFGLPLRDAALHALGLGFVVSMIMGHAPVILPAVARVKLHFSALFYLPLAALHASLALRLGFGAGDLAARSLGAILNAGAIAMFAATIAIAAFSWRSRHHAARVAKAST